MYHYLKNIMVTGQWKTLSSFTQNGPWRMKPVCPPSGLMDCPHLPAPKGKRPVATEIKHLKLLGSMSSG